MKSISFLCLLLAADTVVARVVPRQIPDNITLPPYLFGSLPEPPALIKPDRIQILQPQFDKNAKRELIRWGPFLLPGMLGVNVSSCTFLRLKYENNCV
jgi:hypothetical protein